MLIMPDIARTTRLIINSETHTAPNGGVRKGWDDTNRFAGGTVILKINRLDDLVSLDVNRLK